VARHDDGALVDDPEIAAQRAVSMVRRGGLRSVDGTWVPMTVETLCIHGDAPGAVASARRVRAALQSEGITLRSFTRTAPVEPMDDRST
jgi:5-oxoprolinase (ATP-hydrolysing) subunit A